MKHIRKILFCFYLPISSIVMAGDVIEASVSHDDGIYTIIVEMQLQGNANRIRELLFDFDKMGLYNKSIVSSTRLYSLGPQVVVGHIEIKGCILFFCSTLIQVQKIRKLPSGDLQVTILPELSDYRMGKCLWHIAPQADGSTRLRIEAVMEPKIWVPPLIGPSIVNNFLKNKLLNTMESLEKLSQSNF